MHTCYLSGLGAALPDRVLSNHDLEKLVDTSDEWIRERSGIQSRHVLQDGEQGTDLSTTAAREALALSGYAAGDLTHVIACTCTPEYLCPGTAVQVAARLDAPPVMAFDLSAACSGFVYGLDVARSIVLANPGARILLIGVEALSRKVNWTDRSSCVLFGDGAGATVVGAEKPKIGAGAPVAVLDDVLCHSNGRGGLMLTVGGGTRRGYVSGQTTVDDDFFIHMAGREVF
jgi:3-oxoacyl-[acyl-carrier-protein] synthase-3